jgi:hypothetical protein
MPLISPTLKMEAGCFFERSIDFQQIKRRYVSEGRTLYVVESVQIFFKLEFLMF